MEAMKKDLRNPKSGLFKKLKFKFAMMFIYS